MQYTKIGIVIPIYNAEKTIDKCLESIVRQTYTDLNIILVVNSSTDNSLDRCRMWEKNDDRIKVIVSEKGVSKARNLGKTLAINNGCDYVAFVDADDCVDITMYEQLLDIAVSTNSDMVFSNYIEGNEKFKQSKLISEKAKKKIRKKDLSPFFYINKDTVPGSIWRILFKTDLCGNIDFKEDISYSEDLLYVIEAVIKARHIEFCNETLYYYSIPENWQGKYIDKLNAKERMSFCKYAGALVDRNIAKMLNLQELLRVLSRILKTECDYKKRIEDLFADKFYKNAKTIGGLYYLLTHINKTFKSKISAILIYFGFYDLYVKFAKKY